MGIDFDKYTLDRCILKSQGRIVYFTNDEFTARDPDFMLVKNPVKAAVEYACNEWGVSLDRWEQLEQCLVNAEQDTFIER